MLDTVVTQELRDEGVARDIATRVQRMRKAAGLSKEDPVEVYFSEAGSGDLTRVITACSDLIRKIIKVALLPVSHMPADAHVIRRQGEAV